MLSLRFWFVLMIQPTNVIGKPNPYGLDLLFRVARSRLSKPGIEDLARTSKGESLWEEPTYLHRINVSQKDKLLL